jgi:alkanesulfonate monooxygenase SsuD/methylene tetrahydromethanopterin reductase-like flavin-dependent oxidoreductase (luciferase family)
VTAARFPLRVGVVILPDRSWAEAELRWRRADQLGFAHAWTYDHLTWRSFRDQTWHTAMPTLAAAAIVTERIRLGTLVASPNFRHPLTLAKELIALDDLSGGRITLGIGAGGSGWDATMLGRAAWSPHERADRFEELMAMTHQLLVSPVNTIEGRHYQASEARTFPGCVQQPRVPFAVAATGPRGMALAVEYGQAWVTTGEPRHDGPLLAPDEGTAVVRRQMDRLDAACEAAGRDPASLDRLVLLGLTLDQCLSSPEAFADAAVAYADVGVTDLVVHWPRSDEPFRADPDTFESIFANAGGQSGP